MKITVEFEVQEYDGPFYGDRPAPVEVTEEQIIAAFKDEVDGLMFWPKDHEDNLAEYEVTALLVREEATV